eukprot:209383-Amorphochlora_amoeboformis.AAC.1
MIQGHPPVFSASEKRRGVSSMPSSTRSAALEIFCTGHNVAQYFRNVTVAQAGTYEAGIALGPRHVGNKVLLYAIDVDRRLCWLWRRAKKRKIREVIDVPKAVEQSGNDLLPELLQQFVEHWPGEKRALEKAVKEKDHKVNVRSALQYLGSVINTSITYGEDTWVISTPVHPSPKHFSPTRYTQALGTISQRIKKDANLLCLKNVKATCDTIIGLSAVLQRAESSDESKK